MSLQLGMHDPIRHLLWSSAYLSVRRSRHALQSQRMSWTRRGAGRQQACLSAWIACARAAGRAGGWLPLALPTRTGASGISCPLQTPLSRAPTGQSTSICNAFLLTGLWRPCASYCAIQCVKNAFYVLRRLIWQHGQLSCAITSSFDLSMLSLCVCRMTFEVAAYMERCFTDHPDFFPAVPFYPTASVTFQITAEQIHEHFHVPLTWSPYGYSTYRGS